MACSTDALRVAPAAIVAVLGLLASPSAAVAHDERDLAETIEERVRRWLGSESRADVDRGTWAAGEYRLAQLAPLLLEQLAASNALGRGESIDTRRLLLDALIRLDVDVPAELLTARLERDLLPQTTILLARERDAPLDALLALLDAGEPGDGHRWAAAAVLVERRAPGVAAWLLERVHVRLGVAVRDPGACDEVWLGHGVGGGRWMSPHARALPRVHYLLRVGDRAAPGWRVLVGGALPVYYEREAGVRSGRSNTRVAPTRAGEFAERLLAALVERRPDELGLAARTIAHDWRGAQAYEREVRSVAESIENDWRALVATLRALELVASDASFAERPPIELEVHDFREGAEGSGEPVPELRL